MKKIILSIAMVTSIVFIACSDDDTPQKDCKTCLNIAETGIDIEVCDNGNGTATVTSSIKGNEISTTTINIPEGESANTINCTDLSDFGDEIVTDEVIN